ncbi:class I SAM-dependent methyltransferase [Ilumatobacter coccineus]|uniref:Methyltransferase domain-containing protein n=1 Tax=Ilumatobacter coccineus (strain NBRC 103263 / KCTC 29153 / YM16-304) TaxID=1313172 RepID=A0A6C7E0M8_ILUCY|nr:class I SAM-dependent methyltransferase [Ilumatobacter coccineus]BAN00533.1 hypothetical protein YM304_02190 [Ilumatobacter coccineus YM16-304]
MIPLLSIINLAVEAWPLPGLELGPMLDWSSQFNENVRAPIAEPPLVEQWNQAVNTATQRLLADRGNVSADDEPAAALWQAMVYQRSHINAFARVLQEVVVGVGREEPVTIVDVGCGAGSVAFAFAESGFGDIRYVGNDHHHETRKLCRRMLAPLGDAMHVVKHQHQMSESEVLDSGVGYLFVTCSYLTGQATFDAKQLRALVDQIGELAERFGNLTVVAADAVFSGSRLDQLFRLTQQSRSTSTIMPVTTLDFDMLYPKLSGAPTDGILRPSEVNGFGLAIP